MEELREITSFREMTAFYFGFDITLLEEKDFKEFFLQAEVWDVRQCDICKHTIVTPYNSIMRYHISPSHVIPGNYKSILENGKPVTLADAFEQFRIDGIEKLPEKDFLTLKNLLITKNLLDLKVKKQ